MAETGRRHLQIANKKELLYFRSRGTRFCTQEAGGGELVPGLWLKWKRMAEQGKERCGWVGDPWDVLTSCIATTSRLEQAGVTH
jgi:hypothetical protein